jgi:transposase
MIREEPSTMQITTIGLDLAKNVFQIHGVDADGRDHTRRQLRRTDVVRFFEKLPPCLVGMEACAGAHHWARQIAAYGHEVKLIPPAYVKPYVRRQKNDMADAAAICEAVSRPSMRFVPVKSTAQQAALLAHRGRSLLIRQRTSLINAIRAHCAEFGLVAAKGPANIAKLVAAIHDEQNPALPAEAHPALLILLNQLKSLDVAIAEIEKEATAGRRLDDRVKRLMTVPGIGVITATAIAATVADAGAFRSGREFAAWIGLVPRQQSSGGKERLGGHTKMGDAYLRRLLISGAHAVIAHSARRKDIGTTWLGGIMARKPRMVAAVALANKTARIAWAIMARGESYRVIA